MKKHIKFTLLLILFLILCSNYVLATSIGDVKIPVNEDSISKYSNIHTSGVEETSNFVILSSFIILLIIIILVLLIVYIIKNHKKK